MREAAPRAQLPELTSTRFFAAISVLLGHFNEFLGMPEGLAHAISGGFGVSFFFVLSGFILCYVYWDHFAEGVERRGYRRFMVARIARIYPPYVLALLIITALYAAMNLVRPGAIGYPGNAVISWLANLFALQTFARSYPTQQMWNGPAWSISTEFAFYVACPFLLAIVARYFSTGRSLLMLLALAVGAGIATKALALVLVFGHGWDRQLWLDIVASRNIFWRFPEFLTGVATARLLYGGHVPRLKSAKARNLLLVAGLAGVMALNLAPWPVDLERFLTMRQFRLEVAYMVPFAAIVLALAAGPTFASAFLRLPPLVFLGEISYGVYIYHWTPWTILAHAQAHGLSLPISLVTGVIVLTILWSAASYLWYERPARLYVRQRFGPH